MHFLGDNPDARPGEEAVLRGPGGRRTMTTYIMLMNWTEQGAKNVRDSPKRLDAARKQLGDMGGSFKAFYLTMGEYDMVAVVEAPDDAVLARFALMLAANGNLKSRTLKAFPEFAYREIISSLG
ncbi:GYD family protein [Mesorhizobium huakuii]|nr:GYD family protein [Mesorhizobium huakuii]